LTFDAQQQPAPLQLLLLCPEIESRIASHEHTSPLTQYFNPNNLDCSPTLLTSLSRILSGLDPPSKLSSWPLEDLTAMLRRYLRDLPEPLIPTTVYTELISIAKLQIDSDAVLSLNKLISNLNKQHSATINYFASHLSKVINLYNYPDQQQASKTILEEHIANYYALAVARPKFQHIT
jgi:hypothetical protein